MIPKILVAILASLISNYMHSQLECKRANVPAFEFLLNNPENKFNSQKHSFVIRVYEFKKGQLAKDFQFVSGDTNYVLDPK